MTLRRTAGLIAALWLAGGAAQAMPLGTALSSHAPGTAPAGLVQPAQIIIDPLGGLVRPAPPVRYERPRDRRRVVCRIQERRVVDRFGRVRIVEEEVCRRRR
jgi:hypothetical protein